MARTILGSGVRVMENAGKRNLSVMDMNSVLMGLMKELQTAKAATSTLTLGVLATMGRSITSARGPKSALTARRMLTSATRGRRWTMAGARRTSSNAWEEGVFPSTRCVTAPRTARSPMTPTAAATSGLCRQKAQNRFDLAVTFTMTPLPNLLAVACMGTITQGILGKFLNQDFDVISVIDIQKVRRLST